MFVLSLILDSLDETENKRNENKREKKHFGGVFSLKSTTPAATLAESFLLFFLSNFVMVLCIWSPPG